MSPQVATALISGFIALVVAGGSGLLTWSQVRRERTKWLVDLKAAYTLELYKTRLNSYPELLTMIAGLSTRTIDSVTTGQAGAIATSLNSWLYSTGGLCADSRSRAAVVALRELCDSWAKSGQRPEELYRIRNAVLAFLRHDLDLGDPESYDFSNTSTLLSELQEELARLERPRRQLGK